MKAKDIIKVEVWNPTGDSPYVPGPDTLGDWSDITRGVLSISTRTGSDNFEGFWDQSDTGQFTIVSRGSTADPHLNSLIKTNAFIRVHAPLNLGPYNTPDYVPFLGFITDVNVKYNKNDKQTVTINGTDFMGYLNRLVITQSYVDTYITPNYPDNVAPIEELINNATYQLSPTNSNFFYLYYGARIDKFLSGNVLSGTNVPRGPMVKVEVGKTIYELIIAGLSSGLITYENLASQSYFFYPYLKYDPTMYSPSDSEGTRYSNRYKVKTNQEDVWQNGDSSYPSDLTFKYVTLNDGINKIINQVSVSNTNPKTNELITIDPVINNTSVTTYGPAKLDGATTYTTTTNPFWLDTSTVEGQALEYQNNIIQYQSTPELGFESITIDMISNIEKFNYSSLPDNNTEFYIQHKVDDDTYIYGNYVVSGVRHTINENDWFCEFILRKSEWVDYDLKKPKVPEITLSSTSGTTATTFTASISNYTTAELNALKKVEWMVNFPNHANWYPLSPPSQFNSINKSGYGNYSWDDYTVPLFKTKTVSWNYDDQGTLVGYPSEFFGPGEYTVAVWVTNQDGYTTLGWTANTETFISVTGATAHADFFTSVDAYGVVSFTDASGADTNTWEWNFGDGTTYSGKTPPKKTYAAAGTYTITLTVNNGYDFDSQTKTVTVTSITLPVKYIRLRFQGTVTKAAGATDYTTDLIDTVGGLRLRNLSNTDEGLSMPFYLTARTLDKVQLIAETTYTGGYPYGATGTETGWTYTPATTYTPISTTNFSDSRLNPMSQSYWSGYSISPQNLGGMVMPKYKFHPVITNNPDGSQTKTYDFDLTYRFDQIYSSATNSYYYDSGTSYPYVAGGTLANITTWAQWGAGGSSAYDQRYKLGNIILYPSVDWIIPNAAGGNYDRYGAQSGKTYLPVEISVSVDDSTYYKVGSATWTSGAAATTTYLQAMPPKSTLPLQT